jgi:hypothetical protein
MLVEKNPTQIYPALCKFELPLQQFRIEYSVLYVQNRYLQTMKAYSLDLRRKIIKTDRTEMITRKGLADRFKVSERFVGNLVNP